MTVLNELIAIIDRILAAGSPAELDLAELRRVLSKAEQTLQQSGKYIVNIQQGEGVQIGDRIYQGVDAEAIRGILRETLQSLQPNTQLTGIPENLPRSGVVAFVGRDAVMSELHQMLQQGHRVAVSAIAGMGGIGKTELALQYALKHSDENTYLGGECWLRSQQGDVGTQIVDFAITRLGLKIPEGLELPQQVDWCWQQWREGLVLIVYDDVQRYEDIHPYLPPANRRFKVLLTTRLDDLPSKRAKVVAGGVDRGSIFRFVALHCH